MAKTANVKATRFVNKIGDSVGEKDICCMWKNHFETLYNSIPDGGARSEFHQKLLDVKNSNRLSSVCFTVDDVAIVLLAVRRSLKVLDRMALLWNLLYMRIVNY